MLNVKVDNYEICATKDIKNNVYIKVNIDGQNIIHSKYLCDFTREKIILHALYEIEMYNRRHNLKWGELVI